MNGVQYGVMAAKAAKRVTSSRMSYLLVIAFFGVYLSHANCAAEGLSFPLPKDIPASLTNFTNGEGNFEHFLVGLYLGVGSQEYTYNGSAWVNNNVTAFLFDANTEAVAHHFFLAPPGESGAVATWEMSSPLSQVTAAPLVKIPQPTAVPLLLLQSKFNSGGSDGGLGQVTHVQRLNTVEGLPPSTSGNIGEIFLSPYSAFYAFYTVPSCI